MCLYEFSFAVSSEELPVSTGFLEGIITTTEVSSKGMDRQDTSPGSLATMLAHTRQDTHKVPLATSKGTLSKATRYWALFYCVVQYSNVYTEFVFDADSA